MELMAFQKKPGIMIDIETLSTARNAAVVSIGAVKFEFKGSKITDEFYINVDAKSCVDLGCHVDKNTIQWWSEQPKEVREAWQKNPIKVDKALELLTEWWEPKRLFYCQGLSFDSPIISNLYRQLGKKEPWPYYNEMDSRTIFSMIGYNNREERKADKNYHNALEDARAQAIKLMEFFGY